MHLRLKRNTIQNECTIIATGTTRLKSMKTFKSKQTGRPLKKEDTGTE